MGTIDYSWDDFLTVVGKRLIGILFVTSLSWSSEHIYFIFEDGSACELYGRKLSPCKHNWHNSKIENFIEMAKASPKGSTAFIARLNPITNEIIREVINCEGIKE